MHDINISLITGIRLYIERIICAFRRMRIMFTDDLYISLSLSRSLSLSLSISRYT